MPSNLAPCARNVMDFVTWSVMRGVRLFRRIHVGATGLTAIAPIPAYDFVAIIPVQATLSVCDIAQDATFPYKVAPSDLNEYLPWWPDLSVGSWTFVLFLAKAWLAGVLHGVQGYLDTLPFDPSMPLAAVAAKYQREPEYFAATGALRAQCDHVSEQHFHFAIRRMYGVFRRHGIPFWKDGVGHPFFDETELVQQAQGRGEVIGLLPMADLALHGANPNTAVGVPDEDMILWLAEKHNVELNKPLFVLQAIKPIAPRTPIVVDKNAFFQFDEDTFYKWFGFPYRETTEYGNIRGGAGEGKAAKDEE